MRSKSEHETKNLIENTFFQCALDPIELAKTANVGYAPNGGVFTPHGDIKALIIIAGFDETQTLDGYGKQYKNVGHVPLLK